MESVHTTAPDALRPGSEKLVDRMIQGAHDAVDRFGNKAGPALERLTESAGAARHTLEDKAGELASVQAEMIDSARSYVRERPFTALAAAVVIGALAASMLRTR